MSSKTLCLFTFTLAFLLTYVSSQNAQNTLHCYVCQSEETNACQLGDVAFLTSADCSTLEYATKKGRSRSLSDDVTSPPKDERFHSKSIIDEIFEKKAGTTRALQSFKYICIKVSLGKGEQKATVRTCERLRSDVKDACDFIKQEANPGVTITSCSYCDTDNCNSASFLVVSGLTLFFSVFFVMLKQLF